ncbi:MAG: TIGR03915 family putative DNA repair protein [Candidatus Auribacterota bacterium]|jgi:probable DNA metabolism protein|nr:TIGR03915 family putative DNA repair protein [Candidatus Auribacterota bacterium]
MTVYIYDGSFDGFLCCIHVCLQNAGDIELITCKPQEQSSLFSEEVFVEYDRDVLKEYIGLIDVRLPKTARKHIYYVFLSSAPEREMVIWKYIQFGFTVGKFLDRHITDDWVRQVHLLSRKVGCEAHRMHGFVRFSRLKEGMYYARISPDHNVLPLIGKHFAERLPDQRFMIHDVSRNLALLYDTRRWFITDMELHYNPHESNDEAYYKSLWKQYFESIAIKERANDKLQRQFVPLRYRKYMTEMQ